MVCDRMQQMKKLITIRVADEDALRHVCGVGLLLAHYLMTAHAELTEGEKRWRL